MHWMQKVVLVMEVLCKTAFYNQGCGGERRIVQPVRNIVSPPPRVFAVRSFVRSFVQRCGHVPRWQFTSLRVVVVAVSRRSLESELESESELELESELVEVLLG